MKRAILLALSCAVGASLLWAQQARTAQQAAPSGAPPGAPPETAEITAPTAVTSPAALGNTPTPAPDAGGARELPLDSEPFDVRVHRRIAEYNERHQQRERHLEAYGSAASGDPAVARFADPRKVQIELSDELDRERTSEELSADYAEQAHDVQNKEQALKEFMAKRKAAADALNKPADGSVTRQDMETALANLAQEPSSPETLGAIHEIDQRLTRFESNQKDAPVLTAQAQQEATDAGQELAKLQALEQGYEKEAKAFTADALSARENRLRLANKLEYFVVRAQADDTLEVGRKSLENVEHLAPSPEVQDTLKGPGSTGKSESSVEQLRDCIQKSGDVTACRQAAHKE